jgi:4-amino-4-deoxy-L-arabinose transferase-like glycosyltransferase
MQKKYPTLDENLKNKIFSQYSLILIIIIGISCLIRFYYFPTEIPLNADALYYFWYSSDIYQIGALPNNWTPTNNGWPIFVSVFFTMLGSENIFELMQIQRILSVVISISITIPVYFLCKKFVTRKLAIIGASLIAFDPRLMINSFLGITDPLYLLLISSGLVLFLSSNKKLVISSFFVISLATTVRGEGIVFIVGLFILFFIKYKKEKYKIIFNYIIIIIIITIILLPVTMYRIDTDGKDPIFTRTISSTNDALSKITVTGETDWKNDNVNDRILNGFKILIQYLVWITIPNFIIFLPLGIFLIFKNRNFEKNTIIIITCIMMIPPLYAYTFPANPALDTRYLYTLFPIFSVLAVLSINRVIGKVNKSNTIIVIIISLIILSSLLFYDYKKNDYDHEKESFEIMKDISLKVKGVNNLPTESRYLSTIQTINQWPTPYSEIEFNIEIISYQNEDNLQDWISKSKDKGLTHILIDNNQQRPDFLKEIFFEETKYTYLKKIYDSRNQGFDYQLKVFEINYELFESLKDNIHTP